MKRRIGNILTPLLLAGIVVLALAQTPPAEVQGLPDDKGLATYETVCGACHGADIVIGSHGSRASWEDTVDAMKSRGALGSESDFKTVTDYLTKYFGLSVNVNRATPAELETELGLKKAEVDAIVAARMSAEIPNFDALSKLPGVDSKALIALKQRLKF
ncbi:MAG: hypothetical protein LAP61_07035 [Acidobacteriia bacterium]|nr:hypothetical protein [Terriglobia bacterium]